MLAFSPCWNLLDFVRRPSMSECTHVDGADDWGTDISNSSQRTHCYCYLDTERYWYARLLMDWYDVTP